MAGEGEEKAARLMTPELHTVVIRASGEDGLRRVEVHPTHGLVVPSECLHQRVVPVVPQLHLPGVQACQHPGPRRVERHSLHSVAPRLELRTLARRRCRSPISPSALTPANREHRLYPHLRQHLSSALPGMSAETPLCLALALKWRPLLRSTLVCIHCPCFFLLPLALSNLSSPFTLAFFFPSGTTLPFSDAKLPSLAFSVVSSFARCVHLL